MQRIKNQGGIKVQKRSLGGFEVPVDVPDTENQDFSILRARLEDAAIESIPDVSSYVDSLRTTTFKDGTLVMSFDDMWKEIFDLLITEGLSYTTKYIAYSTDYDNFIFDLPCMNIGKLQVQQEINNILFEKSGVEGLGKCKRCHGKILNPISLQLRSADEGMTSFLQCVNCEFYWKA